MCRQSWVYTGHASRFGLDALINSFQLKQVPFYLFGFYGPFKNMSLI